GGLLILAALGGLVLLARGWIAPGDPGKTDAPPLSEEERDAMAKDELGRIVAFANAASDFENAREVVRRYQSYMSAWAGKKWEIEANRKLTEYRALLEANARAELDELLPGDAPLREQQRWGELLAHYLKYPAKFLETTDSGRLVKEKQREAAQQVLAAYGRDKAEVEKFSEAKKYADA